ncbi:MAG: hypothetical protein FJW80_09875 [Actinobacteria bacterium]|nr:hypothetical protein [Actinomycetota bacterium]
MDWVRTLGLVVLMLVAFTAGIWTAILVAGGPLSADPQVEPARTPVVASTSSPGALPSAPSPYTGEVLAFGDYVLVSVKPCLRKLGFEVDAVSDRRVDAVAFDLRAIDDSIPGGVLIHLGANGGATASELDGLMKILGPDRVVVWTTIQVPDDPERYTFEQDTNAAITGLAETYPNVRIFSWNALSMTNPEWLNADGSMTKDGCKAFASYAEQVMRAGT